MFLKKFKKMRFFFDFSTFNFWKKSQNQKILETNVFKT